MSHYSSDNRQFTTIEQVDRTYYDQQLPFSHYSPPTSQRHVQDSYVYYSAPARYSAPFGYTSSTREEDPSIWSSTVNIPTTTELVDTQPRSMVMDDTNIQISSVVSRPTSSRRTSYSDSQTPPDSTESMSQTGSSSFDDSGYTYSSSSCSSPQPVTPPYPPMDSPAVKVEQEEQGGCFILDELSTMSYFSSSKRSSARDNGHSGHHDHPSQQSSEVPLRATGVSDEMKEMMRCFRVDPFSLHSLSHVDIVLDEDEMDGPGRGRSRKLGRGGSPPRAASWAGLEAKPLDEEPLMFEFQLRIDGSSEESDSDTSDSSNRDSSVSSVEAKDDMQLRPFSPSFQLASEQTDTQEVEIQQQQQQQNQWQEPSGSYQMVTSDDYSGQVVQEYSVNAPNTTLVHPRPMVYSPPITIDASSYPSVDSRQHMSVSPELRPKWVESPRRVDKSPLMASVDHERPENKNRRLHPATSHPYLRKSLQNLNLRHQQQVMHAAGMPHHQSVQPVMEQVETTSYVDYQQQYTSAGQYADSTGGVVVGHAGYAQQVQVAPVHYERDNAANAYVMDVHGSWQQQQQQHQQQEEVQVGRYGHAENDERQSGSVQNAVVEDEMMSVHAMSPSPSMMETLPHHHQQQQQHQHQHQQQQQQQHQHYHHGQVITPIPSVAPRRWSLPEAHGACTLSSAGVGQWQM